MARIIDNDHSNRTVEKRLGADGLARLRQLVIQGQQNREIAHAFGFTVEQIELYLRARRPRWQAEDLRARREDARRIVVLRKTDRETGGFDLRPISLPRISMHVAALEERANG